MQLSVVRNSRLWSALLAGYWLMLFVLTHIPSSGAVTRATEHDKILHVGAFAVLAFLLATAWQLNAGALSLPQLVWAWLLVIMYAAFDEWTQSFVAREASILDWLADAAGAAAGLTLFAGMRRAIRNRRADENAGAA